MNQDQFEILTKDCVKLADKTGKLFKGYIYEWKLQKHDLASLTPLQTEVYTVFGYPSGHPRFCDWLRTSQIIIDKDKLHNYMPIETLNSIYCLMNRSDENAE